MMMDDKKIIEWQKYQCEVSRPEKSHNKKSRIEMLKISEIPTQDFVYNSNSSPRECYKTRNSDLWILHNPIHFLIQGIQP